MSTFAELLHRGVFVVTAELDPPTSASAQIVRRRARLHPRANVKEAVR